MNNKAFGNIFCNSQKNFHTSPRSSFFKLNSGICIYKKKKKILGFFVSANAIVDFEEWLIASILSGELQNKLPKALWFNEVNYKRNGLIQYILA